MAERVLPSPQEAVDIATDYLAQFYDPQNRSANARNFLNGIYSIWAEMGKEVVEPEEFVNILDSFQSSSLADEDNVEIPDGVPVREDTVEIDILRSLKLSEILDVARGDLAQWQEGSAKHPQLSMLVDEWTSRVQMLEAAVDLKIEKDAQKTRLMA